MGAPLALACLAVALSLALALALASSSQTQASVSFCDDQRGILGCHLHFGRVSTDPVQSQSLSRQRGPPSYVVVWRRGREIWRDDDLNQENFTHNDGKMEGRGGIEDCVGVATRYGTKCPRKVVHSFPADPRCSYTGTTALGRSHIAWGF
ncbi:hypothetical protein DER44DRAFT_743240 [Fusarium oxysporum]|nr:hypothetical protein DER44DRAFT_743240 [Fusarium oxysporum]